MGAGSSHPAPLVEVSGPRSRILVPAGAQFSVHPPLDPFAFLPRGRRRNRRPTPIYHRVHSPYGEGYRPRGRPRHRGSRYPPPETEETDSLDVPHMEHSPFARGRMRRGMGMGMGMGPGGMGVGRGFGPGLGMHGPGMPGMNMRRPRRPSMMGMGMPGGFYGPGGPGRHSMPDLHMGEGYEGGMPHMPPHGMSPGFGRGPPTGMGGPMGPGPSGGLGAGNPYACGGRGAPSLHSRPQTPMQPSREPRPSARPPGLNEIPMGAYIATAGHPAPTPANTEPLTSKRLNRVQGSNKKVGPSGQEWIEGDPFLDACTCTTNCTCRKGQRVLYRSQARDGDGHNGYGEIRYVLRDDLGRDCGDHSAHRKDEADEKSKKKRGKGSPEDRFAAAQEKFVENMEAMNEKMEEMNIKEKGVAPSLSGMPPNGLPPSMIHGMDPRMAPQMGGNPYGMSGPEGMRGGMSGPMRGRLDCRMGMPGPMMGGMGYRGDMSFSDPGFGIDDMMDPAEIGGRPGHMMGGRHPMPPGFRGPHRSRGPRRAGMGMGGFRGGPPPGAQGMGGRRPGLDGRRRRPTFADDGDLEFEMSGMRGGMGDRGSGGRSGFGDLEDDDDEAAWEDENDGDGGLGMGQSPSGRGRNGGRRPMGGRNGMAGRQARVDDEDEDI